MTIEKKERQGERKYFERKQEEKYSYDDLTPLYKEKFKSKLEDIIDENISVIYLNSTVAVHKTSSEGWAYVVGFYPLDVNMTVEEIIHYEIASEAPAIIDDILEEHIQKIKDEIARVKTFHPDSKLTLYFSPADMYDVAGDFAENFYVFLIKHQDHYKIETESSFLVVPNDVCSLAY